MDFREECPGALACETRHKKMKEYTSGERRTSVVCKLLGRLFRSPRLERTTFEFELPDAFDILLCVSLDGDERSLGVRK